MQLSKKLIANKIERIYALSPMQEGLLFAALYKDMDEYISQWVYALEGKIDLQVFKEAWEAVVAHHPILRSGFIYEGISHPVQYVSSGVDLLWCEEDWLALSESEQQQRLEDAIRFDRQERFDLKRSPLMRFKVMRCGEDRSYFMWTRHHLLMDGWSGPIVHQQVMQAYEQIKNSKDVNLPYSRPYEDYIAWLSQQDQAAAKEFWKGYLGDIEEGTRLELAQVAIDSEMLDALENKVDIINKDVKSLAGEDYGYYETRLGEDETEQLKVYAAQLGVTVNTVVQGVWAYVLSRYTSQKDVVFGVTMSGRSIPLSGIEEMVGVFINTLPLRVRIDEETSIEAYFQKIQLDMAKLNEYGYLSLAGIQGQTQMYGRHQLFNTTLTYQNYPDVKLDSNKTFYLKWIQSIEKSEYDLNLNVCVLDFLTIKWRYQKKNISFHLLEKIWEFLKDFLKVIME
jgi:NRPS condensation-like uncharacterized protein